MLTTPLRKLAYIVAKAREYDAEVESDGMEDGSNASDDMAVGILEDTADNPTAEELQAALEDLNDDEIAEVLALVWVGRGDFEAGDWEEALAQARAAHDQRTPAYLIETPNFGDLLEQGLEELDQSIEDEA